ncbi:cytochrome c oxidase subunit II [Affinirhizobium pseudoryzae]|uniref:cytochrome c oxidase subunit II n=1 Tax=Allorhizobium pseudoryzae TaxID=379684 RepID=UPI001F41491D|nr:cytochrome c oxidase subunit II [Allorhizobium pseudoryzae]
MLALSGCTGDLSALHPAGPSAASIADLWWVMFWAAVGLFSLVLGLFLAAVSLPHFGRSISAHHWTMAGGLILPIPILAGLTFYAFAQGEFLLDGASRDGGEVVRISAVGRMWQWEFSYPDLSAAPPTAVLHIPVNKTVEITTTSQDVIHSFWVPRLGGKIDAIPGHANILRIRADQPGRYGGVCSEYCGTGHAGMRFEVQAHTEEDFRLAIGRGSTP